MKKLENKQKEKEHKIEENKIEISGKTKTLFCSGPGCGGLLYFDRKSGFHKCNRCGRYWKYIGKRMIMKSPQRVPEREKLAKKIK